jgi:stage II sporulation protein M
MIGPELGSTLTPTPPLLKRLAELVRGLYRDERALWNAHYRRYFKISARLLALGFILGFVYFLVRPAQETRALALVMKALKDIPLDAPPLVLALTIFYHNAFASALAVAAGILPFLCLPVLDPLVNGATLGLLASISKHQGLNVPLLFLKSVAPHGAIELTAVLYATSVGIYLSVSIAKRLLAAVRTKRVAAGREPSVVPGPEAPDGAAESPEEAGSGHEDAGTAKAAGDASPQDLSSFVRCLAAAARSFMLVVLPLLLIAAFIEAFVTPVLR